MNLILFHGYKGEASNRIEIEKRGRLLYLSTLSDRVETVPLDFLRRINVNCLIIKKVS